MTNEKNKNNVLPLQANQEKILLVGPYGDNRELIGLWAVHGKVDDVITIKEAISNKIKKEHFTFEKGCDMLDDYTFLGEFGASKEQIASASMSNEQKEESLKKALQAGKEADVIIFAMGEHTMQSGEAGSRTDITLPSNQQLFINEMVKLGKKNILINISGRPLELTKEAEQMDAIIQAWFPGTKGADALSSIIFGEVNPSGRLSMSFPRSVGQLPIYYNEFSTGRPLNNKMHSGRFVSKYLDCSNEPLFPFGYGLSYGEVSYKNLRLSSDKMTKELTISIDIINKSEFSIKETVQLYIQDLVGSVVRPVKELKQYKKINLKANEKKTIEFKLTRQELFYYTKSMEYTVEPGEFKVYVGKSSQENIAASFELV